MIPNLVEKIEEMPFTANGKLNRMELKTGVQIYRREELKP